MALARTRRRLPARRCFSSLVRPRPKKFASRHPAAVDYESETVFSPFLCEVEAMASTLRCCAVALVFSSLTLSSAAADSTTANAPDGGSSSARAKALVEAALQAGLAGDAAKRAELLAAAIAADGEYAPARWQTGQLKFNGQWRTPDQVAELVSCHQRWREYRELRDASRGTLPEHVALAQWCLRNGLAGEERYHWSNVLLANPSHTQARQRLNVREYRGGLFTEAQIAEHEKLAKEAASDLKKYKPQFITLVRQSRNESRSVRESALAKIRGLSDLRAIPALQEAIGGNKRKEIDDHTRDLNLAVVTALGKMREHDATLHLLNYALFSQSEEVRKLAGEALGSRPATDYVPLLMASLAAPIEAEFDVVAAPDGTVRMVETLYQSGPEADKSHTHSVSYEVEGFFGRDAGKTNPAAVLSKHLAGAQRRAEKTQARVASYNAAAAERNAHIQEALKNAAGMELGADPEQYWQAWKDDNELYYDEEPTYDTYDEETYTYYYDQSQYPVTYGDMRPRTPPPRPRGRSCFAPGTPVWTHSGPRPIEQIAVGEMVLAQQPSTGELAFRPVLQTIVGQPVPVLRLSLPGESITTTLGHRFWASGRGWQMAKKLKPAMTLHAVSQAINVDAIEKGEDIACHNLVVDEFHTFFVGKSRLLVHDNSCPRPTTAFVPGMTAE
jgi:hypothetical protein